MEELYAQVPFTNFNLQPRWQGLPQALILESLRRFALPLPRITHPWAVGRCVT